MKFFINALQLLNIMTDLSKGVQYFVLSIFHLHFHLIKGSNQNI